MSTYTPGPWTVDRAAITENRAIWGPDGICVGIAWHYRNAEANANLMAAAPDLLAALRSLLRFCELHEQEAIVAAVPSWYVAASPNPIEAARDAIAKATGTDGPPAPRGAAGEGAEQ
jgi:hypothetical protein